MIMKAVLISGIVLSLAITQISACPDTEDVVWALDERMCKVFRNECYYTKENLTRKPAMEIVSKDVCQLRCPEYCIQIYQPVSGTYLGETRTFGNLCELMVHSCKTGKTFV
ncbi:uncharacterized protein LOC115621661 [Scaptodrosophila lebanonensis]|uniref:Uncharacterized protein LOC115621661 n=1 Tax=Drosophila lebanonensis TaxID=7225 RepID=A0A6J2T7W9_DROLE|nr:uncharacterized protein LOC115621661 [Scaptodrosophila lebanonensis]